MVSVYCLKLENGKYYVGKTKYPNFRINDHFNGNGSEWTRLYKPLSICEVNHNCDDFDEDKYTKMAMAKFGIDNVRGGTYTQITLPNYVKNLINKEIQNASDKCFNCGKSGHFAKNCVNPKECVANSKECQTNPKPKEYGFIDNFVIFTLISLGGILLYSGYCLKVNT